MKNLDIRMIVSEKGLKYKDIADEMNISPEWLSRLMKNQLTVENKVRIMGAIANLLEDGKKKGKKMDTNAIGRNLKRLMKENDMDVIDICHKGDWEPDTIQKWLSGKRQPSAYAVRRLSMLFGVTMEQMMEGVE